MLSRENIVKEIQRVENITLGVKEEIKTLKNRVRAYKGWTKRYRKQHKELKQEAIVLKNDNIIISQERDTAVQELNIKQQSLLKAVEEARQAKELRDKALSELDEIIAKIEQYKEICDRANKIIYADKIYLIKEAEKLFFDEEILTKDINLNTREYPQMFTDQASIGRSLLDK